MEKNSLDFILVLWHTQRWHIQKETYRIIVWGQSLWDTAENVERSLAGFIVVSENSSLIIQKIPESRVLCSPVDSVTESCLLEVNIYFTRLQTCCLCLICANVVGKPHISIFCLFIYFFIKTIGHPLCLSVGLTHIWLVTSILWLNLITPLEPHTVTSTLPLSWMKWHDTQQKLKVHYALTFF